MKQLENLVYFAVWGVIFASPLLNIYIRSISGADSEPNWVYAIITWQRLILFLALFLIHNFILAPLITHKHKRWLYFAFVSIIVVAFSVYQCNSKPTLPRNNRDSNPEETRDRTNRQQRTDGIGEPERPDDLGGKPEYFDRPKPPKEMGERPEDIDMPMSPKEMGERPEDMGEPGRPKFRGERPMDHSEWLPHVSPPPIIGERDIVAIVILILMFAANLGLKGYFRSRYDRKRLAELEKNNLEQQLEYLRYQINPHFFMNTLNNIHALVDIDPAKAQETIVELSKMMRFVLYESDKNGVALSRELEFIRTYIRLMSLRYTDKVMITTDFPEEVPNKFIPPLMLIPFVENAFKHGVSYRQDSFIGVTVTIENNNLHFTCANSKVDHNGTSAAGTPKQGGVGLANVRKRLKLIYGNSYSLDIQDGDNIYSVALTIGLLPNPSTTENKS
ncbi:MAG: histidine kinase [Bacteroidaceae bacterium]|nr:histidine kinase [Bacteroidaceae bacterium]